MIDNFRDLRVWQDGIILVKNIYSITKNFPEDEKYGITSQMRRASVSVPSNIAEGFRRQHKKEFKQFLNICLGSLAELETQLFLSKELEYIDQQKFVMFEKDIDCLARMIATLMKKI